MVAQRAESRRRPDSAPRVARTEEKTRVVEEAVVVVSLVLLLLSSEEEEEEEEELLAEARQAEDRVQQSLFSVRCSRVAVV